MAEEMHWGHRPRAERLLDSGQLRRGASDDCRFVRPSGPNAVWGAPDLLGEAQMSEAPFSARRAIGVILATLLGVVFFNALLGVFGLSAAIIALLLFISLAVLIFYA